LIFSLFQLGFTFIFNIHPFVRPALQITGGLYLVFLGMQMLSHAKAVYRGQERTPDISVQKRQSWKTGFLTQITNPKTFFVYMSAYTSFFPHSITGGQFMIFLGCIFCLEMSWYSLVAGILSAPKPRAAFLKRSHIVNALCGTIILILGGRLLIEIF
jgi:threonine/homoserine/homoserine lactone efflux protein